MEDLKQNYSQRSQKPPASTILAKAFHRAVDKDFTEEGGFALARTKDGPDFDDKIYFDGSEIMSVSSLGGVSELSVQQGLATESDLTTSESLQFSMPTSRLTIPKLNKDDQSVTDKSTLAQNDDDCADNIGSTEVSNKDVFIGTYPGKDEQRSMFFRRVLRLVVLLCSLVVIGAIATIGVAIYLEKYRYKNSDSTKNSDHAMSSSSTVDPHLRGHHGGGHTSQSFQFNDPFAASDP